MKLGWYSQLSPPARRTFLTAFGGLALDSMDTTIYALLTPTLIAILGITKPEAGLLATANLVGAAIGGWIAGIFADRFGRVRVLQVTILIVAVSTASASLANGFWFFLAARVIQGLGYGGEAAVGAVLVAEAVAPALRGRAASAIQSGYAVGNTLSVLLSPIILGWFPPDIGWRVFLAIGLAPALCVIALRRMVPESELFTENARDRERDTATRPSVYAIFAPRFLRSTICSTLFTAGTLGGAYVLITWLPTYVRTVLALPLNSTAAYLGVNIFGSFCGPLAFGAIADRIGRRRTFAGFLIFQAVNVTIFTLLSPGMIEAVALGFLMGAMQGGLASGLMPTFAEMFPTELRANGAGFALSAGRGLGAVVPAAVGFASVNSQLGLAMAVCALAAYALALVMVVTLPETNGVDLRAAAKPA